MLQILYQKQQMAVFFAIKAKQILKFLIGNGNDLERLIIHYYKPMRKEEIDPIQKVLKH